MASSHTRHNDLHHAVSIDRHVRPPPALVLSDDEDEAHTSPILHHHPRQHVHEISRDTRQVHIAVQHKPQTLRLIDRNSLQSSLDSDTSENSSRSPSGSISRRQQSFSFDSSDSLDDGASAVCSTFYSNRALDGT